MEADNVSTTTKAQQNRGLWHHGMKTLPTLLALCGGIHWSLVISHQKFPVMQTVNGFFAVILDKLLIKLAADLRHHSVHVTSLCYVKNVLNIIYCRLNSGWAWLDQATQFDLNNPINLCLSRCIKTQLVLGLAFESTKEITSICLYATKTHSTESRGWYQNRMCWLLTMRKLYAAFYQQCRTPKVR